MKVMKSGQEGWGSFVFDKKGICRGSNPPPLPHPLSLVGCSNNASKRGQVSPHYPDSWQNLSQENEARSSRLTTERNQFFPHYPKLQWWWWKRGARSVFACGEGVFPIKLLLLFSPYIHSEDALMLVWMHFFLQGWEGGGILVWVVVHEKYFRKGNKLGLVSPQAIQRKVLE